MFHDLDCIPQITTFTALQGRVAILLSRFFEKLPTFCFFQDEMSGKLIVSFFRTHSVGPRNLKSTHKTLPNINCLTSFSMVKHWLFIYNLALFFFAHKTPSRRESQKQNIFFAVFLIWLKMFLVGQNSNTALRFSFETQRIKLEFCFYSFWFAHIFILYFFCIPYMVKMFLVGQNFNFKVWFSFET